MKKRFIWIALLALIFSSMEMRAQQRYDLTHFGGIKSEGTHPADLSKDLDQLYNEDLLRAKEYNAKERTDKSKVLRSSYQISKLMASGRILYGDPITQMINHIADTLLRDYPELRTQLRFYTVKSPEVNAFATGQGMIFVNIGLVAQVEDEADLAFVISHEIIHYYRQHSMEYTTRKKAEKEEIEEQEIKNLLRYHSRSREMENEADSLGLALFYTPSPYDKKVTEGVFDVLQYGYLSFDEIPFDTLYFSNQLFHLPSDHYLKELSPITARDDYNDSLSTHPNLLKRREKCSALLAAYQGGSRFVICTQGEFADLQTLARFECIRQNIIYSNYARAFYDSYILEKSHPGNPYLAAARAQSLYSIAKFKIYKSMHSIIESYKEVEGEMQQPYYTLQKMSNTEAALVAMREVWKAHLADPSNPYLMAMAEDIMSDIKNKLDLPRNYFHTSFDTSTTVESATAQTGTKYDRIRQKKRNQSIADPLTFVFADFFLQDDSFAQLVDKVYGNSNSSSSAKEQTHRKNILSYSPTYLITDDNFDVKIKATERAEKALPELIEESVKPLGYHSIDLSDRAIRNCNDATEYNDLVTMNEWCNEFWQSRGDFDRCLATQSLMDPLLESHDADLITVNTILNVEGLDKSISFVEAAFCIIVLPILPIGIYNFFSNKEKTYLYTICMDATKGHQLSHANVEYPVKDESSLVKNIIYTNLYKSLRP